MIGWQKTIEYQINCFSINHFYETVDNKVIEFQLHLTDLILKNAVTPRNLNKSQVILLKLIAASSKDFSIDRQIFFFSRMCFL